MGKWYVGFSLVFFVMMGVVGWYANTQKTRPVDSRAAWISPTPFEFRRGSPVPTRAGLSITPKPTAKKATRTRTTEGREVTVNSLTGMDQLPQGMVRMPKASLAQPGYVTVHADSNGTPGEIIGATVYLERGEHINLDIPLSRDGISGELLFAVIYVNTDDNAEFNSDVDMPFTTPDGSRVMTTFRLDGAAPDPYAEPQ